MPSRRSVSHAIVSLEIDGQHIAITGGKLTLNTDGGGTRSWTAQVELAGAGPIPESGSAVFGTDKGEATGQVLLELHVIGRSSRARLTGTGELRGLAWP